MGNVIRRQAGHIFISEGEETDFALVIRAGHVKALAGKPARIIAIRGPGDVVGEMAAIRRKPRSASIVAINDVEVLHLPAGAWMDFLHHHPRAMVAQLYNADERLDQVTRKIVESDMAAEQRLARALVQLVDRGAWPPEDGATVLGMSQPDIASLAWLSTDSVKKIIRAFRERGIVETGRQTLWVMDDKTLRLIAAGEYTAQQ
ncbi:Crp/Fnr family transcriptional regulator [Actinokineospora sp. NBRC 105648]|nr:Crp/Fnr family transcriptional regulator [Actinokineospora sp. NBRC 105648]